jgi:hypothetical protein
MLYFEAISSKICKKIAETSAFPRMKFEFRMDCYYIILLTRNNMSTYELTRINGNW